MSTTVSNRSYRIGHDHFEPEAVIDPAEQRKLRGHLEQIDYAAFAANREVLGQAVGPVDLARFQRLAIAAAQARAHWVNAAMTMVAEGQHPSPVQVAELATLRQAFEELIEVYDGMRRMIERGYLHYQAKK